LQGLGFNVYASGLRIEGGTVSPGVSEAESAKGTARPRKTSTFLEGRYRATWKREFKRPWREAGPPNHHDDIVDSDQ